LPTPAPSQPRPEEEKKLKWVRKGVSLLPFFLFSSSFSLLAFNSLLLLASPGLGQRLQGIEKIKGLKGCGPEQLMPGAGALSEIQTPSSWATSL
jgi:hypothetical protein